MSIDLMMKITCIGALLGLGARMGWVSMGAIALAIESLTRRAIAVLNRN
jgi:hypothetical protein